MQVVGRRLDGAPSCALTWKADSMGRVHEYFDVRTGLRRATEQLDPTLGSKTIALYSDYATRDGYVVPMRMDVRAGVDTIMTSITRELDHGPIAPGVFAPPSDLKRKAP